MTIIENWTPYFPMSQRYQCLINVFVRNRKMDKRLPLFEDLPQKNCEQWTFIWTTDVEKRPDISFNLFWEKYKSARLL